MTTTLTYRADPDLKAALVAEMADHARLDQLIQGAYLNPDGKGCAVGCTISGRLLAELGTPSAVEERVRESGGWHETWAQVTGLPQWLGELDDTIFEGLTIEESKGWPLRLLEAVPVGVDLAPVRDQIIRSALFDPSRGAITLAAAELDAEGYANFAAALQAFPTTSDYSAVHTELSDMNWQCEHLLSWTIDATLAAMTGTVDEVVENAAYAAVTGRRAQYSWLADMVIGHLSAAGGDRVTDRTPHVPAVSWAGIVGASSWLCTGMWRQADTGALVSCPRPGTWDVMTSCPSGHDKAGLYCDVHKGEAGSGGLPCSAGTPACGLPVSLVVATPLGGGS